MLEVENNLAIAGVDFELRPDSNLPAFIWPDVYQEFLDSRLGEDRREQVLVRLVRGLPAELNQAVLRFDGAGAWSLLTAGDDRYIVRAPLGREHTRWVAHLPPVVSEGGAGGPPAQDGRRATCPTVTIHCGDPGLIPIDGEAAPRSPLAYPLDQIMLMYHLATRSGVLLHATGVTINGRLILLAGRSGAGKSTIATLLTQAQVGMVISDDRLVLRVGQQCVTAHGTPWPGTARIARNQSGPAAALLFLEHGPVNQIEPLTTDDALRRLLPLVSILWHEESLVPHALETCEKIVKALPVYRFQFTPDQHAVGALVRHSSIL